jgi:hypothetical protein
VLRIQTRSRTVAATEAHGVVLDLSVLLDSLGELGEDHAPRAQVSNRFSWIKINELGFERLRLRLCG